jgi:Binding domain of DNA repair protein Ercc1 (rad10/Swi10)
VCRLRLLLCLVDTEDNVKLLLELNKLAVVKGFTLLLAWTWQEAARYLETFKAYENKPPTSIQEKVSTVKDLNISSALTVAAEPCCFYILEVYTSNSYQMHLLNHYRSTQTT